MTRNNLDLDLVINFKADLNTIKKRILDRSKIENRPDDNLEVIKTRLEKYFAETEPLAGMFKEKFKDPQQAIPDIAEDKFVINIYKPPALVSVKKEVELVPNSTKINEEVQY